jgi:hypothetical protein
LAEGEESKRKRASLNELVAGCVDSEEMVWLGRIVLDLLSN